MEHSEISAQYAEIIRQLESTGEFRVLRAVASPTPVPGALRLGEKIAIIVDTETTGLDLLDDEIVEIGIIAFAYDESDNFTRVIGIFESLREPENEMSEDASNITGITKEMLRGKKIDTTSLSEIIRKSSLVIAHNASFDRPMCEKLIPDFKEKAWACSATEIPWKTLGYEGAKLGYLLYQEGLFHKSHRALDDCYALLNMLTISQKRNGRSGLQILLASARETRIKIEVSAPFDLKGFFKAKGYRWKTHPVRKWYKDVAEAEAEAELREISKLDSTAVKIFSKRLTAFDRFKNV